MLKYLYRIANSFIHFIYSVFFSKQLIIKFNSNNQKEYETIIADYSHTFKTISNNENYNLDGIVRIVFNRPKKKNAFNELMYNELIDVLNKLSNDSQCKICILTGNGDFYSSGNDLANFIQLMHPLAMAKKARLICEDVVKAFINFKKPLICIVNGPAIGIAVTTLGTIQSLCTLNL